MSGSKVINAILEREGIPKPGTFAKSIGVTPTQVYDLMSGKTKRVSSKIAEKILKVYPAYNFAWLLTGEGNMLKEEQSASVASPLERLQAKVEAVVNGTPILRQQGLVKLGYNPKASRGIVERLHVAAPEIKNERKAGALTVAIQQLLHTSPSTGLWVATGEKGKTIVDVTELEALKGQIKALQQLNSYKDKELEVLRSKVEIRDVKHF